jgi:uncharacterized protein YukE
MTQLRDTTSRLQQLRKRLNSHWEAVKASWTDNDARKFEQQDWNPFEQELRNTVKEMEHLAQTIENAKRHTKCGK